MNLDKPVYVYRNLRKKCFSVKQGGRVVDHVDSIYLRDAEFIVQPGGQARVRREKRKNVHAFVKGYVVLDKTWIRYPRKAMYDPYMYDTFVDGMTWKPLHRATMVYMSNGMGVIYSDTENPSVHNR